MLLENNSQELKPTLFLVVSELFMDFFWKNLFFILHQLFFK